MSKVSAEEWKAMAMKQDLLITSLREALRRSTDAVAAGRRAGATVARCFSAADVAEWRKLLEPAQ